MLYSRSRARHRLARRLSWLVIAALTTAALLAPGAASTALGADPVATYTSDTVPALAGNPSCDDVEVTYANGQDWNEFKLEGDDLGDGLVTRDGLTVTISDFDNDLPTRGFTWTSNFGVDAVIIKTGNGAGGYNTLAVYAPTADSAEATSGSLTTESPTGISHISFCYDTTNPPPSSAPPSSAPPSEAPELASILIAKLDDRGTADPEDDVLLDGASFEVYLDDGDETFDDGDELVFGAAATDAGLLDTDQLEAGWYWIVEAVVPAGFVGSDPILVELNTDASVTCAWDAEGLIGCEDNTGDVDGLSWTIVLVDNSPVEETSTPTGGVGGATGTPGVPGITLPPTDTLSGGTDGLAGDGWRLILLAMAGLMAAALLVTPATVVVRQDRKGR